jgi:methyl-accepting chemotaxis protein
VTDIMSEIMAASQEQSAGIEQVNQTVSQMDQAIQQNSALVEEAAAASDAMRDEANRLSQLVGVFRLEGAGGRAPALPATATRTSPRRAALALN